MLHNIYICLYLCIKFVECLTSITNTMQGSKRKNGNTTTRMQRITDEY